MEEEEDGSRIGSGMTKEDRPSPGPFREREGRTKRKAPRWTVAFLRALERTGEVRASADDAGVDHTTAYGRRKAHPDFAEAWDGALAEYRARREREEEEEALPWAPSAIPSAEDGPPPRSGEELIGRDGQVKRAGHGRWSKAKERAFLAELATSANVKRAAKAVGISTSALYPRRMRDKRFALAWDMAVETAKARARPYLVEALTRTFDPNELPVGDEGPTVTVAEAIRIAKLKPPEDSGSGGGGSRDDPFFDQADDGERQHQEMVERIVQRLERLGEKTDRRQTEQGWRRCEENGVMVPPGWARPDEMAIADSGRSRLNSLRHCPHCGGGLKIALPGAGGEAEGRSVSR